MTTHCAYCGRRATGKIVSIPEDVCLEHALEFWNGLMMFVTGRLTSGVRHTGLRMFPSRPDERSSIRRAEAIAAAGPSPQDHERSPIRLAS